MAHLPEEQRSEEKAVWWNPVGHYHQKKGPCQASPPASEVTHFWFAFLYQQITARAELSSAKALSCMHCSCLGSQKTPHPIVVNEVIGKYELTPSEGQVRPWVARKPQKFRMKTSRTPPSLNTNKPDTGCCWRGAEPGLAVLSSCSDTDAILKSHVFCARSRNHPHFSKTEKCTKRKKKKKKSSWQSYPKPEILILQFAESFLRFPRSQ